MSRVTATPTGSAVTVRAPAKVNLFLELRGRRADGYHDLETLMVAVDLADSLTVTASDGGELALTCNDPALDSSPANLVCRAAELLRQRTGHGGGSVMRLEKNIPTAAGLGGGSSDAAAALLALNQLWNLGQSRERLAEWAGELGSDVPFFLLGHAAWCTGRGEIVESLAPGGPLHFVLVCPPFGCPTAEVYRRSRVPDRPRDGTAIRRAVASGDAAAVGRELFNRLEAPAAELRPELPGLFDALRRLDPLGVALSGSGSTVFAVARDDSDARRIADRITQPGEPDVSRPRVHIVRSVA